MQRGAKVVSPIYSQTGLIVFNIDLTPIFQLGIIVAVHYTVFSRDRPLPDLIQRHFSRTCHGDTR